MHHCIFRAPMSFFDSTPSRRILNRASADQSSVDLNVATIVGFFAFATVNVIVTIGVMSQVAWQVFIIFIPVIAICLWLQHYYISAARELARLCGVCKAPVIQHFSETLWIFTIRSFDQESRFRETRAIDASVAGLAVAYGLNLNMMQAWVVQSLCYMENSIISMERILQYTCIPSEPPLVVETNRPERRWPVQGEVHIQDLEVRYGPDMPLVLRGITCTLFGGKKSGMVGRTGSGSNYVRANMDPLEEYTDVEIWEALDKCQLGDEIRRKEKKLDSPVCENGENWSVGQRQLVCLGRVLLRKSKVLVLDEATASVDTATDNLIQQTLNHHFLNSTVIAIAHRITSVLDGDTVLLLDHGVVKECDSPEKLLEEKSSARDSIRIT